MAGAARRLIITLAAAAAAAAAAAGGNAATTVAADGAHSARELAGAYHEAGGWVQVIPVDSGHAYAHLYYAHLYFLGGIGHDLISELEGVMTIDGSALTYREPAQDDTPGCSLTMRRVGNRLAWTAPERAPCTQYANGHFPGIFRDGSILLDSRRPASRTHRYPGEADGYAAVVSAWRKRAGR